MTGIGIANSGFFGKLINAPKTKQIKRMDSMRLKTNVVMVRPEGFEPSTF